MDAEQNPLISVIAIDDRPDRFHRQRFHQFKIIPECLQTCICQLFSPPCNQHFSSYCTEEHQMTVAEQIVQHLNSLPETAQAEVLDFVEFPESRSNNANWSGFSLTQAMRGMESEESPYSLNDIKG